MGNTQSDPDYAGDLSCSEAWELLKGEARAQIVDVRTIAEWNFVGLPDLSALGRRVLTVEWQSFPSMEQNPHFLVQTTDLLSQEGAGPDDPILLLCRSGARSRNAAMALSRAGFTRAYNVISGFEGDPDHQYRRGLRNGWKASGLPWRQG